MFNNRLPYEEFLRDTLKSITGDSVVIDHENIDPNSQFLCSNGFIYTYQDFWVPDTLYRGEIRMEGENLLDSIGADIWAWNDSVNVTGYPLDPSKVFVESASEEHIITAALPSENDLAFSYLRGASFSPVLLIKP